MPEAPTALTHVTDVKAAAPYERLLAGTSVALKMMSPLPVLTIGHSTRSVDEFIRLLTAHEVDRVIDIRTVPRSRHNPQFSRDMLSRALRRVGMRYTHMPGLGGLRHPRWDSANSGWRNAGFRGYADYMQTATFRRSLDRCIDLANDAHVVLMCAEAVPWRCHRSLVADALIVRGIAVSEITSGVRSRPHSLTPWAEVNGIQITYPDSNAARESRHPKPAPAGAEPKNHSSVSSGGRSATGVRI